MEFDKSKILTMVTANQLKEGQMGWINDYVDYLKSDIKNISPYKVFSTNGNLGADFPFTAEGRGVRRYFYPAPEQTYRPFNNNELNDLVGEVLTNKQSGRRKLVTGKPTEALGVNLDGSYITAKDLLSSFYRNTNEPCGIKEEA